MFLNSHRYKNTNLADYAAQIHCNLFIISIINKKKYDV